MPFPSDEVLMKTAGDLVAQLQALFGKHPGFRASKNPVATGVITRQSVNNMA